jgi:hypothetical protein
MSESKEVEKPCVEMAEALGWMCKKLDIGPGGKGWLDQLFLGPNNSHFIVEFKEPFGNGLLSPKQRKRINDLRAMSHDVYIVEDVDRFESILKHQDNIARLRAGKACHTAIY